MVLFGGLFVLEWPIWFHVSPKIHFLLALESLSSRLFQSPLREFCSIHATCQRLQTGILHIVDHFCLHCYPRSGLLKKIPPTDSCATRIDVFVSILITFSGAAVGGGEILAMTSRSHLGVPQSDESSVGEHLKPQK